MSEEWRPIAGYAGYEISNMGNVRRGKKLCPLKPYLHGYIRVSLINTSGTKSISVHSLVLTAFVGPRPEGYQTRHLNNVRSDNRLENLAWGTAVENYADKVANGTAQRGENCGSSKLDSDKVRIARWLYSQRKQADWGADLLAAQWGVDRSTVRNAAKGITWKHLDGEQHAA
jgi:hypothetical protein